MKYSAVLSGPRWVWCGSAVLLMVVGSACGAGDAGSGSRGAPNGTALNGGTPQAGSGGSNQGTDAFGNSTTKVDTSGASMMQPVVDSDACQSTGKSAETGLAAVDIVWIIDGSGSMADEAERLQMNIDSFVASISSAGVDTHVVLVGETDLVPAGSNLATSGNYLYVQDKVDSWNALDRLIERYPDYQSFLRPTAHVHFIIVTDDESRYMGLGTPEARAQGFEMAMDGMLDAEFTVHAIASPGTADDLPCIPESVPAEVAKCCQDYILGLFLTYPAGCDAYMDQVTPLNCPFLGGAAAPGVTYQDVATSTGGVFASICAEDWTGVFSSLSDAVIESAPLPCNYAIPPPPQGMSFDVGKVNVKYTPPGADPNSVQPYGHVADADACGDREAWYFDDPTVPSEVLLCPSVCEQVGSGQGGTVDVLFGCATIMVQ